MKKNIVILGSNNNIGVSAINFFESKLSKFNVFALSYDFKQENIDLFIKQIEELSPKRVFVTEKKDAEYISSKVKVEIFQGSENFPDFIKSNQIDEVISALSGITSVKKILSAIYEFKDITLLNTSPLLYCGRIIINEVKSKGVKLNVFSYPVYSMDFLNKTKNTTSIDKVYLFSKKQDKEKISIDDYKDYISYMKKYFSQNKIRLSNDMFLINYIYNIPVNDFCFYNQTKRVYNTNIKFTNGTSVFFASNLNLDSIFNYYFLNYDKTDTINHLTDEKEINVTLSKIDVTKEKYLSLAINALEKGGSCPIIYYITLETLINFIYSRKIKENIDVFEIVKEFVEDKTLFDKYPDLSSVCSIEQTIIERIKKRFIKEKN